MALPRPSITAISKAGATGTISVSGTGGNDVQAFIVRLTESGNNIIDGPSRSGDGDIILDLSLVTFTLFGTVLDSPFAVFVATTDGAGNYSLPSQTVKPELLVDVSFSIAGLKRTSSNSKKLEFVVSGLPDPSDEHKLIIMWSDRSVNFYAEAVSADNGKKTLTADFDEDWAYSFIAMGLDPSGSWMLPVAFSELWNQVGIQAPELERVIVNDDDRSINIYFTVPSSIYDSTQYVLYRDITMAEKSWHTVEASQSPAIIGSLYRNHVYQVQMVSKDAHGKFSLPSQTIEARVLG